MTIQSGLKLERPSVRQVLASALVLISRQAGIAVVAAAVAVLGGYYSLKIPVFESYGEPWHLEYILQLAGGEGLPSPSPSPLSQGDRDQLPVSSEPWEQRARRNPPLYYALGALLAPNQVELRALSLYERNPFAAIGLPEAPANKNAVLHREDGNSSNTIRTAVTALRRFSVLCCVFVVILTYCIVRQVIPEQRLLAVGVAALLACTPQFLFTNASLSNQPLTLLFVTGALYMCLRLCYASGPTLHIATLTGCVIGLAALTDVTGLAGLSLVVVACAMRYLRLRRQRVPGRLWPEAFRPLLVAFGAAAAVCGWWYVRNLLLYRSAFEWVDVVPEAFYQRSAVNWLLLFDWLNDLVRSYWGLFGWRNILADQIYYTVAGVLSGLGAIGLLIFLARIYWRRRTLHGHRWAAVVLLSTWVLVAGAPAVLHLGVEAHAPAISSQFLIPCISFFFFIGITSWLPEWYGSVLGGGMILLFAALAIIVPLRYIVPAYARPVTIPIEHVPITIQEVDVHIGDGMFLLGYEPLQESTTIGHSLRVRLYWLCLRRMDQDYAVRLRVFGRAGEDIGDLVTYPGGGNLPTRSWVPGDVLVEDYTIPTKPEAAVPVAGVVRVDAFNPDDRKPLPISDARGQGIGAQVEIARVRLQPARVTTYQPGRVLEENFSDSILLTGHDPLPAEAAPGQAVNITLYWKCLVPTSKDYTVFVHLLNSAGELAAQVDEQPLSGDYPTRFWASDEIIRDTHTLPLPATLPQGDYELSVGLYLLEDGQRLPIVGTDPPATSVVLTPVRIRAGS